MAMLSTQFERDRAQLENATIIRTANAITGKEVPTSWSIGLFVSTEGMNKALAMLRGITVGYDPTTNPSDDTIITVRDIAVEFTPGFAAGAVELTAASKKRGLSVDFDGSAALVFKGFSNERDMKTAVFKIYLLKAEPIFSWSLFSLGARGYAGELLTTGLMAYFSDQLTVKIPIKDSVGLDFATQRDMNVPVREPKNDNYVRLMFSVPEYKVSQDLMFEDPIYTKDGLWLLANLINPGETAASAKPPKTEAPTAEEIEEDKALIAKIAEPTMNGSDISVWLNAKALDQFVGLVQAAPQANRTVTVKSTKTAGRLSEKKWSDNLLGDGGVYAELTDDNAVKAHAELQKISSSWSDRDGLNVVAQLHGGAKANVHVHVDPLVGGGAGTSVGLVGNIDVAVNASITTKLLKVDGHDVVALYPVVACEPAVISLKTDGKLKLSGVLSVDVASIGGIFKGPVGARNIPPKIVLSDLPFVLPLRSDDGKPLVVDSGGRKVTITAPSAFAELQVLPISTSFGGAGFLTAAKLKIGFMQSETAAEKDRKKAENSLEVSLANGNEIKPCDGDTSFALTVGDLEFGENNTFIKMLKELSPEKFKEWVNNPSESFQRSDLGKAGKAIEDGAHHIGKEVHNFFHHL